LQNRFFYNRLIVKKRHVLTMQLKDLISPYINYLSFSFMRLNLIVLGFNQSSTF